MEYIISNLVEKARDLGFNFKEEDVIFDNSRAYALYIKGYTIGQNVSKFGAYRNYLGGGLRGSIENSSLYVEDKKLKELAQLFENALKDIESLDYYEDYAEHLEYYQ